MIQWAPYTFVRLTFYLITGILLGIYVPGFVHPALPLVLVSLAAVYLALFLLVRTVWRGIRLKTIFGLLAGSLVILSGLLLTRQRTAINQPDHVGKSIGKFTYYQATITSEVQERAKSYRAEAAVQQVLVGNAWRQASGKVLVYIRKESPRPRYGDQLLIKGMPQPVRPPANPGEFDYQRYLANQQLYHQQFIKPGEFIVFGYQPPNPVFNVALHIRQYADGVFKRHISSKHEYAIATALVLGVKDGLDNEIKQAYSSAGAMHVVAVSGTHVSIVFAMLLLLLGKLKKLPYGNLLFAVIALLILWLYAFVTGLSASVLRAVVMFSFVVVAQASGRQTNMYNTLAASMFALLCYNPYLLMDVGFQLSYVAVLGIVHLQPALYQKVSFGERFAEKYRWLHWLADNTWKITSVSIAAQLATFPMSLLYFHQFPTYFLLSNLAVIPLSSAALITGMATLAVSWIPYVVDIAAWVLQTCVWLLNQSVFVTEAIPGALINGISIGLPQALLLYAGLLFILLFGHTKRFPYWYAVAGIVALLVSIQVVKVTRQHGQHRLAVYAVNKHAAVDVLFGNRHSLIADQSLLHDESGVNYHLVNGWWQEGASQRTDADWQKLDRPEVAIKRLSGYSLLVWRGKRFVLLHERVTHLSEVLRLIKPDYLVVQHNALRRLDGLEGTFGTLIIDSSNKFYVTQQLRIQATDLHILCHATSENGAFILSY